MALILGAFGLASGAAWAQGAKTGPTDAAAAPPSELKALADSCDAHKFETMVVVDGSGRGKRVKICGEPGQTDAEWLVTLRDSAKKVAADPPMTQVVKDQIVAALKIKEVADKIIALGGDPSPMTPAEFDAFVRKEIAINAEIVKASGYQPQ